MLDVINVNLLVIFGSGDFSSNTIIDWVQNSRITLAKAIYLGNVDFSNPSKQNAVLWLVCNCETSCSNMRVGNEVVLMFKNFTKALKSLSVVVTAATITVPAQAAVLDFTLGESSLKGHC